MKKLLILGWESVRNQQFVEDGVHFFNQHGFEVTGVFYDHRSDGTTGLDWEIESSKLQQLHLDEYDIVIAKSMGSGLTSQLIQEWMFHNDTKVLLLGVPLKVAMELWFIQYYNEIWNNLIQNITIIQNEFDPTGSYQMVSDYFSSNPKVHVECIKDNETHVYVDYDLYFQTIVHDWHNKM